MDSDHGTTYAPQTVLHPGDTVVDYLESHEWSQSDLARRTGLTPKTISEICNGKAPITPTTALAFEKVFQRPAHLWLNLQRQFDEADARRKELEKTDVWKEWAAKFPVRELKKRGWLAESPSDVTGLLGFLGVSSPESWHVVWKAADVSYRQTRRFKTSAESMAAWARVTELYASELNVAEFDEPLLRSSIEKLRSQTRVPADEILERIQEICGAAGVAVVVVPELPHTGISGCARWLNDTKALIALTLRYKTDDQFWFTFFHELAHVLLHGRKRAFVLDNAADDLSDRIVDPQMQQVEDEANRFSADTLIPPSELSKFIARNVFDNDSIYSFSEKIGVGPGIVVGRLQFEGLLAPHQGNALKQQLGWKMADVD